MDRASSALGYAIASGLLVGLLVIPFAVFYRVRRHRWRDAGECFVGVAVLAVVAAGFGFALGPTPPASAHTDACARGVNAAPMC